MVGHCTPERDEEKEGAGVDSRSWVAGSGEEIRNSKSEIRKKPEGENSKLETEGIDFFESFPPSGFLHFRFELFSDFEFLVSSFPTGWKTDKPRAIAFELFGAC